MKDPMFGEALSEAELSAWQSLKSVVTNFLRNHWSAEYEKEIEEPLKSFRQLGVKISVKPHILRSYLDYFPKNCVGWALLPRHSPYGKTLPRWDVNFPADYYWCLKRDAVAAEHKRKSLKRPFIHEKLLLCIFQFSMAQRKLSANISALNLALFVYFNKKINSVLILIYTFQVRNGILKIWSDKKKWVWFLDSA